MNVLDLSGVLNVRSPTFGAKGNGVTDDSAAFNSFFTALSSLASGSTQDGNIGIIPKGNYFFGNQVTYTIPNFGRSTILAGGAEITTSGAISGLKITGGATGGGATIIGLQMNHRGNANATFGFDMPHCDNVTLDRCYVRANGVGAGYAGFHLYNSNAADDSTGSLWNTLLNCGCGKDAGGDSGDIPFSVLIEGASNANLILGGQYGRSSTSGEGVRIQNMTGQTTVPNAIVVRDASFEGLLTHIHMSGAAASAFGGMRFIGNRFESGTTVFSITGSTTQPAVPPYMAGNYITPAGGTYLNNPNSINVNSFDTEATAISFSPTLTFATIGNLSVSYAVNTCRFKRLGNLVYFDLVIQTSSFTYTTSSGAFQITLGSGMPYTPSANAECSLSLSGWTKANYTVLNGQVGTDKNILVIATGSGQSSNTLIAADVPSGGTVIVRASGSFPITGA